VLAGRTPHSKVSPELECLWPCGTLALKPARVISGPCSVSDIATGGCRSHCRSGIGAKGAPGATSLELISFHQKASLDACQFCVCLLLLLHMYDVFIFSNVAHIRSLPEAAVQGHVRNSITATRMMLAEMAK
jgi:hypothetical protein